MRENGFYWVKWLNQWTVAECQGWYYHLLNFGDDVGENELEAIGDKIDIPEKYR